MQYAFFFSSRRRHTRSLCDWSSDVCSSDLDLLHPQLEPAIVKQQAVAGPNHLWQVEGRGDAAGLAFEIADCNRQAIAADQWQRVMPAQPPGSNLRTAEILKQRDDAAALGGRLPHSGDRLGVALVRAVREVEAEDVHTGVDQLADGAVRARCRTQRGDNLRLPHNVSGAPMTDRTSERVQGTLRVGDDDC